jgi:hypothetical protein
MSPSGEPMSRHPITRTLLLLRDARGRFTRPANSTLPSARLRSSGGAVSRGASDAGTIAHVVGQVILVLLVGVAIAGLCVLAYFMGVSSWPWGRLPSSVRRSQECPRDGLLIRVDGPQDRPDEDPELYPSGRDWCLYSDAPYVTRALGVDETGQAERIIKARLPWRVRFGVEWDSEGQMIAVYGNGDQIALIARAIHYLGSLPSDERAR